MTALGPDLFPRLGGDQCGPVALEAVILPQREVAEPPGWDMAWAFPLFLLQKNLPLYIKSS